LDQVTFAPVPERSTKKYCVEYDKQVVTVTGTVLIRTIKYDNPNDAPPEARKTGSISFPVLILDQPMCSYGADDDEQENLQWALSLIDSGSDCARREWPSSTRVKVTGTIFHGDNWHHHTQVLFIAKQMEALGGKLPRCVETIK
jgi:hypothetical protein